MKIKLFLGLLFSISNFIIEFYADHPKVYHISSKETYPSVKFPYGIPEPALDIVKKYLPKNPVILEAGSFNGEETVKINNHWPLSTIYAFEPVPKIFDWLTDRTRTYKNIHCFCLALSNKNGLSRFFTSEEGTDPDVPSMSGSLLAPKEHLNYSDTLFKKEIEVATITIDDWAQLYGVDHIDFLWLDMQGFELDALKAAPKILKTVKAILTEVEFVEAYAGQYMYDEITKWMEEQGFVMIARNFDLPPTYWFGDALFVRKELL